jgi:hypothetical protein
MSPIANYTTTITARKSIKEIEDMLVAHGARQILYDYDLGKPVGLSFIVATRFGEVAFKIPTNIDKVKVVLAKQRVRVIVTDELATRVAWRILKDWVRAQMAILETEMVSIDQVFLPYMQVGEKGKTLYEVMLNHRFQLPEGKE